MKQVKAFYRDANACVKMNGEKESFRIHWGMKKAYMISLWLFSLLMNGVARKVQIRIGNVKSRTVCR